MVNVITQDGDQLGGLSASVRAGSFGSREGQLTYGDIFDNGLEVVVSGTVSQTEGHDLFFQEFASPESNNGLAENGDDERFESAFALLSYKGLTLQAASVSSEKGFPTAAYDTVFNDPRNRTVDENSHFDLSYERAFANQTGLAVRVFADRYDYDGDYVYDYSEDDEPHLVVLQDWSRAAWWGAELKFSKLFSENHRAIFGLDYRNTLQQDQGNFDDEAVYLDDQRSSHSWAVYGQDEIPLGGRLRLHLGLRYDHYDTFGGTTNPRAGLLYTPRDSSTVKLLYGKAFRTPNAYELFLHDGGITQKPGLELDPESIQTYELVWEEAIGRRTQGTVSLFSYRITGLISLTTDPEDDLLVFRNADQAESEGLEVEVQRRWKRGLRTLLSYCYQDTRDRRTGDTLSSSPRHLAKLKRFPFDTLKIDRSFVKDLTSDPDDASLVEAIIAMARSLGLRVVGEGVETEEQLRCLAALSCDEVQGFYFSPAVPPEEFLRLLSESDHGVRLASAADRSQSDEAAA